MIVPLRPNGESASAIRFFTDGGVEIPFGALKTRTPFHEPWRIRTLTQRLNQIPGVSMPEDGGAGWPSFSLSLIVHSAAFSQFVGTLDWARDEFTASLAHKALDTSRPAAEKEGENESD